MKRNLNTSYRLVWNEVLGAFVVVSELAKAKGKRSTAVLALAVAGISKNWHTCCSASVPQGVAQLGHCGLAVQSGSCVIRRLQCVWPDGGGRIRADMG